MVRNEGKSAQRMHTGIEVDGREKMKDETGVRVDAFLLLLMPVGASNTSHIDHRESKAPGRSQAPLLAPVWLDSTFVLSYRTRSEGGIEQSWIQ